MIKNHEVFASPTSLAAVVLALRNEGAASVHRNRTTGLLGIIVRVATPSRARGLAETMAEAGFHTETRAQYVVVQ